MSAAFKAGYYISIFGNAPEQEEYYIKLLNSYK